MLGMKRRGANLQALELIKLRIVLEGSLGVKENGHTSSDQVLKVSISLAAQTFGCDGEGIQPAWEMLHPQLPTCKPASSSSSWSAFDVHSKPSDEADSRMCSEVFGVNCTVVISSECVELCTLTGATGWRGSLVEL